MANPVIQINVQAECQEPKKDGVYATPLVQIGDPPDAPTPTYVLEDDSTDPSTFLISCQGRIAHTNAHYLSTICARVYSTALPYNSPYLNTPYPHDPGAKAGYVPPNSTLFFFYGSANPSGNSNGAQNLIPLAADPTVSTMEQYLYVWGTMSNGENAEPCAVTLVFNTAADKTDAGDTDP